MNSSFDIHPGKYIRNELLLFRFTFQEIVAFSIDAISLSLYYLQIATVTGEENSRKPNRMTCYVCNIELCDLTKCMLH